MPASRTEHELPDYMRRMLDALEQVTGRTPMWRVMSYIVLLGLTLTAVVITAVWQANRQRDRHDFEAVAEQIQGQVQERLIHRRWMLEHAASEWSAKGGALATTGRGFEPGELWLVRSQDPPVGAAAERWQLSAASVRDLTVFWWAQVQETAPFAETVMSPALTDRQGHVFWVLVRAADLPERNDVRRGWAMAQVHQGNLLSPADRLGAWQLTQALVPASSDPHVMSSGHGFSNIWQHRRAVQGAEGPGGMALLLSGTPSAVVWQDALARDAGIWIAGGFGLLFTLMALHAYLLLISTRVRAREMARQSTTALERSESRTRAVVDTAPDAILTINDDGMVRWCNQASLSIFGQSLDGLKGQSLGVVIPALEGISLEQWFQEHGFGGRVIGFETEGRRVDGTAFPIAISARRVELEDGHVNTIFVRDTTDAKWAEHELLLRERALASSADGIIITDMTLPGQPTIFVNAAFEKITGYAMQDILGMNCRVLQREDNHQPGIELMRQAIAKGEACQVVVRNYRRDGTLFWNELTISPVRGVGNRVTHYVGVAADITDRMAAEQVLHLRTERLNAVFDLSPDGFVVLDKRGEVSIVNPAFERMTGLHVADLVGLNREGLEERLLTLCTSTEEVEDDAQAWELLHLHTPGIRTLARRIRHGGHDNETVMYFRDITQELEVDRMKSEFLSMAAHELRTPMASIYGFTELLLKRQFDEPRRMDMLGTIHRQAHILINLINELLDLARIEARRGKDFKQQQQSLKSLIHGTVDALLVYNDDRKVGVVMPDLEVMVNVDTEKLSQAITNVLSNAYKYSPHGGRIDLDIIWRERAQHQECGIRVRDQGIGMSAEHLSRLFERFFRADTSGNIPGTGLGMTLVKEIVELHGGQVTVESEAGQGTTVVLWLPLAENSQVTVDPAVHI